jgi:hypothetical protein
LSIELLGDAAVRRREVKLKCQRPKDKRASLTAQSEMPGKVSYFTGRTMEENISVSSWASLDNI